MGFVPNENTGEKRRDTMNEKKKNGVVKSHS